MFNNKKIRLATKDDSVALLNIYECYIRDTAITFEIEVPSVAEFAQRIESILERFPWIVCEIDGEVIGYAYASKHGERAAYQWSADLSIYVNSKYHRRHIATALYTALLEVLRMQGYYTAFAATTVPNPNSEAFHSEFGFETVGVFDNVGYKLGEWRSVKWFKLTLCDYQKEPTLPVTIGDVKDSETFEDVLRRAVEIIG